MYIKSDFTYNCMAKLSMSHAFTMGVSVDVSYL